MQIEETKERVIEKLPNTFTVTKIHPHKFPELLQTFTESCYLFEAGKLILLDGKVYIMTVT